MISSSKIVAAFDEVHNGLNFVKLHNFNLNFFCKNLNLMTAITGSNTTSILKYFAFLFIDLRWTPKRNIA